MKFTAIVREVRVKALASMDKGIRVILETEDPAALELVNSPADSTVTVEIS